MKKTKYVGFRISAEEYERLVQVQEFIARNARGQKPEITDILRSLIGWGNPLLVSEHERQFIATGVEPHGLRLPSGSGKKQKSG